MSISILKETGKPISVLDEGVTLSSNISSIDLVGAGVSGTALGDNITATIPGGGGANRTSRTVTPSGTINGQNKDFTLTDTPDTDSLHLYLNGMYQTPGGVDYTLSGVTITYINAPFAGSAHNARYEV